MNERIILYSMSSLGVQINVKDIIFQGNGQCLKNLGDDI